MSNNVLYYPFINIPAKNWLVQPLLYWKQVQTIVPFVVARDGQEYDDQQNELIKLGLIREIYPDNFIHQFSQFSENFLLVLDTMLPHIDQEWHQRRRKGQRGKRVHSAKFLGIELIEELMKRGLAHRVSSRNYIEWLDVEPATSELFMMYLANCLSRVRELDTIPLTNGQRELPPLKGIDGQTRNRLPNDIRHIVLNNILPVPTRPVPPVLILDIKNKYGEAFGRFRSSIEDFVVRTSNIQTTQEQDIDISRFCHGKNDEIREIKARLDESRVGPTLFATLGFATTTYSAIMGANAANPLSIMAGAGSILYAAHQAARDIQTNKEVMAKPMAYAAVLQRTL